MAELRRRAFLKLSCALAVAPFAHAVQPAGARTDSILVADLAIAPAPRPFGRAIHGGLALRDAPSAKGKLVRQLGLNEVVALLGQAGGDGPTAHNPVWYQTLEGWVHSAFVQPCENNTHSPLGQIEQSALVWGEVSVPVTEARARPDPQAGIRYRLYYSCIVQVIAVLAGKDGAPWYQVDDGNVKALYVRAEHLRPVAPAEVTPLSPDVPAEAKRIEVDLAKQMVTAYEDTLPVFSAKVATGLGGHRTTPGEHRVFLKTASRRMIGGARGTGDFYDLPGIGWVSYFTASRIAFHSTYWHNDFGSPRSHGCVNMLPEDARWIFRWTTPPTPYDERWARPGKAEEGSLVKVF